MLPPIQLRYFFSEFVQVLTGLTLAFGGARPPILDKMLFPRPELPPRSMFPPELSHSVTWQQDIGVKLFFYVNVRIINCLNHHVRNSFVFFIPVFALLRVNEEIRDLAFFYFNCIFIREFITNFLSSFNSFFSTPLGKSFFDVFDDSLSVVLEERSVVALVREIESCFYLPTNLFLYNFHELVVQRFTCNWDSFGRFIEDKSIVNSRDPGKVIAWIDNQGGGSASCEAREDRGFEKIDVCNTQLLESELSNNFSLSQDLRLVFVDILAEKKRVIFEIHP